MNNIEKKKLLILGASEVQLPLIIRAKELGHFVIVADYNPEAVGLAHAHKKLILSTNDVLALLEKAKENNIDGVLTSSDLPVRAVAHICNELKISGPTVDSALLCTDKYLLREHLSRNNFLVPRYSIIRDRKELEMIDFFPCVIKPIDSSGSRGVRKVCNSKELENAFGVSMAFSNSSAIIVEEFIDGEEYSIESLTQNNETKIVAITAKTVIGEEGKYFVEDRHVIPANIEREIELQIRKNVLNLINSLDLQNSASHTELKVSKKGIYFIEVGPRLGGDYITSDLVPLATGVDMLKNAINIALNIPIDVSINLCKYSGIQFISSENYENVTKYLKTPNPYIFKHRIDPYQKKQLKSSFDRLGYFIVHADGYEQLNLTLNCK